LAFQHLLIVTVTPMTPIVNVPFSNPRAVVIPIVLAFHSALQEPGRPLGPAGQCRATVWLSTRCDEGR